MGQHAYHSSTELARFVLSGRAGENMTDWWWRMQISQG